MATYPGDSRHLPSSSPAAARTVNKAATTIAITGDLPDASFVGQATTIGFAVAAQAPGSGGATGTVTVTAGALSCSRTLVAADAGAGSCTISFPVLGAQLLLATYAGDADFLGSTSPGENHQVVTATIRTAADVVAVDGACSLREAVQAANANGVVNECGYGSYTFDLPAATTLALGSALPAVTGSLTLAGPGASQLALSGGDAVRLFEVASGGRLELSGLTLTRGRASGGGAILNSGTLSIADVVVERSQATGLGGAILSYGALTVQGSTLSGNSAFEGGALDVEFGTATVTRSTFSGNSAAAVGGAVWNGGTLSLSSVTIAGNTAPTASAVYNRGTARLRSSLVAGSCAGGLDDGGHNLDSGNSCGLTATTSRSNADPLLSPLADNGGPTPTRALPAGSPAINAGSPAACAEAAPSGAAGVDQRGVAHVQTCDIGAYESPLAASATALVSSGAAVFGEPVTLTATVSSALLASGQVVFRAGTTALGAAALDGVGQAVYVTASLPVGRSALSAVYQGDAAHDASTSPAVTQVVGRAATRVSLAHSPSSSSFNQPVTLTATVTARAPGQGVPSGSIVFRDGAGELGTVALSGGTATLVLPRPALGTHVLVAEYSGSASFDGSLSASVDHVVSSKPAEPQLVWHAWFAVDTLETPYVGDFDGDGKTDIITFTRQNPNAVGDVYVALSDGTRFVATNTKWHDWFAITTDETVVIGDYDGDGKDDIATWLGKTTRQVYVARSTGTGMTPESVWAGLRSAPTRPTCCSPET